MYVIELIEAKAIFFNKIDLLISTSNNGNVKIDKGIAYIGTINLLLLAKK